MRVIYFDLNCHFKMSYYINAHGFCRVQESLSVESTETYELSLLAISQQDWLPDQVPAAVYNACKIKWLAVHVGTDYSEWKPINQGVGLCQGCSLPSLLFIICMNDMIKKWQLTSRCSVAVNMACEFKIRRIATMYDCECRMQIWNRSLFGPFRCLLCKKK
jgi:hypothetical protein